MTDLFDLDDELTFAAENEELEAGGAKLQPWRILIVDDEPSVHQVTRLALEGLEVDGRTVELLSAFSEQEGRALFAKESDVALGIIDVIMETDRSGLDLVDYIRNDLENRSTRLILRTGQPGQAPEREIVQKYDINDYKSKTELTSSRLFTTVVASLRSYRDLVQLQRHTHDLTKINAMLQSLYQLTRVDAFASTMVHALHDNFNFSKKVFVFERRKALPHRCHVIVQSLPSIPPVAPIVEAELLFEKLPSLKTFFAREDATWSKANLLFTKLQSKERQLFFIHEQEEDIRELSDDSLSLLTQQLDTAYSNTTLYDDHLELNLAMERFVPDSTLKHLNHDSITTVDIGQRASIPSTTLSLDIRGFTSLCENLSSNESFNLVNSLLALLGPVVERHHGSILKFVGDGIIAMFARHGDHMRDAVHCGIALAEAIRDFNARDRGTTGVVPMVREPIRVGIGVHSGRIHMGTVGAANRIDVSIRGFSVSMAELLQTLTKPYGITMLIDDSCMEGNLEAESPVRFLGISESIKGKKHRLFQVIDAEPFELRKSAHASLDLFALAREKLEAGQFEEALNDFEALKNQHPQDPVLEHFATRSRQARDNRRSP